MLEYFRATGPGWQTRVDEVLRKYATRRPATAKFAKRRGNRRSVSA
ncbi:MAG: BrnA antitoxin family protein [Burkholderiales bacterium]